MNETGAVLNVMDRVRMDCLLLAGRYTLLDRTGAAEVMPRCPAAGTGVVIGGVFNSGILATGVGPGAHFDYERSSTDIITRVNALEQTAIAQGTTLATAALQFALAHPAVGSVLVGSAKPGSILRNAGLLLQNSHLDWSAFDGQALN